jgi:hypothetical protein
MSPNVSMVSGLSKWPALQTSYLANTMVHCIFAFRKLCRYTPMPGRLHFDAARHLLDHLRCCLPQALKFYIDPSRFPIGLMLQEAGHGSIDPSFFYTVNSSFQDCDTNGRSTGCCMGFLAGGCIDHSSFVPPPIAMSTAEAETNVLTIGAMATRHKSLIFFDLLYGNPDHQFTVPIFSDSQSMLAITANDCGTR